MEIELLLKTIPITTLKLSKYTSFKQYNNLTIQYNNNTSF
jgi:hypothetical protein